MRLDYYSVTADNSSKSYKAI